MRSQSSTAGLQPHKLRAVRPHCSRYTTAMRICRRDLASSIWAAVDTTSCINGQRIGGLTPGGKAGHFTPAQGVDVGRLLADQQQQSRTSQQTGAPQGGTGQPDMSGFFASPDYNFRRTEGQRGIEGSFAARGMGQSGNALRALTEFNGNLASGEFGNYFNRLAGIAGVGQTATNQTAAYGADAASQAGRNALIAGNARASGIQGQADAWGQTAQGLSSLYGYYNANRGVGRGSYGGTGYGGGLSTPGYGDGVRYA
jgi:hypothetical protein